VPVKTGTSPLHAGYFGVWSESAPEIETRWRSEVNSNCRYRFLKLSYDSIMLGLAIETGCEALLPRTAVPRVSGARLSK
jgi:hypothetical protein